MDASQVDEAIEEAISKTLDEKQGGQERRRF
jgi:hypothetical protein